MTTLDRLRDASGFTLVEMIIVVFLLALAMLGILAVFDASARINKSEQQVADAQGNVRYATYQMTRVIRMAGAGGLHVRQAVLNAAPGLAGISPASVDYDNVPFDVRVTDLNDAEHRVRQGTDMIEIRGVILSPLYGALGTSCAGCTGGADNLAIPDQVGNSELPGGVHYNNDDTNRKQFAATVAYTATAAADPMLVLVASGEDQSFGCSPAPGLPIYPQAVYNVARLASPAAVVGTPPTLLTFTGLSFTDANAQRFNGPDPAVSLAPTKITNLQRAGVLDDILYFIDDGLVGGGGSLVNPDSRNHPTLAQAIRRGDRFDVVAIADDVEDMQIAYGVDVDIPPNGVNPTISSTSGGDEWTPNVNVESAALSSSFANPGTCPALHGVMISLLAKSRDPDPTYHGPSAAGYRLMNVRLSGGVPETAAAVPNFRRRVQTLRIALRNYEFEEP